MAVEIPFVDTLEATVVADTANMESVVFVPDSIFRAPEQGDRAQHHSLFYSQSIRSRQMDPRPRMGDNGEGNVFIVALVLVILLCIAMRIKNIRMKQVVLSAVSQRHANVLMRNCNIKDDKPLIPVSLIYYATLAIYGYVATKKLYDFSLTQNPWMDIGLYSAGTIVLGLVRYTLMRLLGGICAENSTIQVYIINTGIFQMLASALLLPLVVFGFYTSASEFIVWFCAGIVALIFAVRLIRGLGIILNTSGDTKVYLFYYLCIIEIVPILIFVKLISKL